MNITDKFGELDSAFSWQLRKHPDGKFDILVFTKPKLGGDPSCYIVTNKHKNLYDAVDEAIALFREHLNDCSLC